MPEIPPWIRPADEASFAAQGYQIGSQIGRAQAEQALQQAQALRQQQQEAVQQARWEAEFGLQKQEFDIQAKEAARKSKALLDYQNALQSGMDPLKALVSFGPGMGQPVTSAASAVRAMNQKPVPAWREVDLPQGLKGMLSSSGALHVLPKPTAEKPGGVPQIDQLDYRELAHERDRLEADEDKQSSEIASLESMTPEELKKKPASQARLNQALKRRARIADIQKQIDAIRTRAKSTMKPAGPSVAAQKAARANELSAEHPDWDRDQVIEEVNKEFANAGSNQSAP